MVVRLPRPAAEAEAAAVPHPPQEAAEAAGAVVLRPRLEEGVRSPRLSRLRLRV